MKTPWYINSSGEIDQEQAVDQFVMGIEALLKMAVQFEFAVDGQAYKQVANLGAGIQELFQMPKKKQGEAIKVMALGCSMLRGHLWAVYDHQDEDVKFSWALGALEYQTMYCHRLGLEVSNIV